MTVTVRVEGLREVDAALGNLPKATGKNVLRRVGRKALEPFADRMAQLAPDDPATKRNDLKRSIAVSTKLSKNQRAVHRKLVRDDKASVEVFAGAGPVPQAHMQEFGTVHHDPQPFGRPAWDASKNKVLEDIKRDLWTEIDKAAARLARKAARGR